MNVQTKAEVISFLNSIREEIDNNQNKNKSPEVRQHYLNNAKHYTEIIEQKINEVK